MNYINEFLDKFYEKIPGSCWAIIGGVFGLLVFLIATILHSITEPISFFTHWVSHLGWGPNGSEPVFRVGLIILGCLLAPYIIFLTRFLWDYTGEDNKKMNKLILMLGLTSSVIAIIGLFFTSIFGNIRQSEFYLHLIGAVIYFAMAMELMILYTSSMILSKKWNKFQIIMTLINLVFLISLIIASSSILLNPDFIFLFRDLLPDWRGFILWLIIPQTKWLTFFEWLYVIANCVWFILTGIHTLKMEL